MSVGERVTKVQFGQSVGLGIWARFSKKQMNKNSGPSSQC